MNYAAIRELVVIIGAFLLLLALLFFLFRLKAIALFFLVFSLPLLGYWVFSPISQRIEVKMRNKSISGEYMLTIADSSNAAVSKKYFNGDTSRVILDAAGTYKFINAPTILKDSIGKWSWVDDGGYMGVSFTDTSGGYIDYIKCELPCTVVTVEKAELSSGVSLHLEFIKKKDRN
jgi:hypothetical protein